MVQKISLAEIRHYETALRIAQSHFSHGKYSIVALAAKGKRIRAVGTNKYPARRGGHGIYSGLGIHAEIDALSREDLSGTTLFLAGVKNDTDFEISAQPCPRCSSILRNTRIRWIIFRDNEKNHLVKIKPADLPSLPIRDVV